MPETQPTVSLSDVLSILAEERKANRESMLEFAKELRKPTEDEQKKIDDDKAKIRERNEARIKMAKQEEAAKEAMARSCPHGTYHPGTGAFTHQFRAQLHAPDGELPYFVPRCTQCGTSIKGRIIATSQQIAGGIGLDQYKGLTLESLQAWADQSMKEHGVKAA